MICPNCGYIDKSIPTPVSTKERRVLCKCSKCGVDVYCIVQKKTSEVSKKASVLKGERMEEYYINTYLEYYSGESSEKNGGDYSDIDRRILDKDGNVSYYLELKERANTINAYRITKFPYAKIIAAKKLIKEKGKPVVIVIKFLDCWAGLNVDVNKEYKKGDKAFIPNYRSEGSAKQKPVLLDVEELKILKIKEDTIYNKGA